MSTQMSTDNLETDSDISVTLKPVERSRVISIVWIVEHEVTHIVPPVCTGLPVRVVHPDPKVVGRTDPTFEDFKSWLE